MRVERLVGSPEVVLFVVCFFVQGRSLESASFIRGDVDASGQLEITDGIRVLGYLFLGNPASLDCREAADADASGAIDISDPVYILNFLFGGGAPPRAPFPACGPSAVPGGLGCDVYTECGNEPPQASFTYSPPRGRAPLEVTFDGSGSSDPEGAIVAYAWSFGDGEAAEGSRVTHAYPSPGSYTVTLTVTDAEGARAAATALVVAEGETEPTSFELIDRALAAGEIDAETALIYRVFEVFEDERLPARFHGGASALLDTHLVAEVIERYEELSDAGRAVLAPFLIPPAAQGSWLEQREFDGGGGAIEWETVVSPSGRVKVWSQTRYGGDSVSAAAIAGAVDEIWDKLVGLMRREPLPDGEVSDPNGGDAKFDIYIVRMKFSGEAPAYKTGFSCSQPNPAYVLIDGRRDPECLLPTVAHEIMHAIQWTYVAKGGCIHGQGPAGPGYRWWMEASATWAQEYVFRKDKNECEHPVAFDFLSQPETPLEFSGRPYDPLHLHPYGAYLWPFYLERSSGSPDYVRTIWENCTVFTSALEAIDQSLPEGFRKWWPRFALFNWNDHPEFNYRDDNLFMSASRADPATGRPHPEGETFTPVELDGQVELEIPLFAKVQHLSSVYYHFRFSDETVRYVAFQHFFDPVAHPTARVQAMILMEGDSEYTYEDWTERPLKTYCRDRTGQQLQDLVIILTNSEWKDRTHVLTSARDPVLVARNICYPGGTWTGTITNVWTFGERSTMTTVDGVRSNQSNLKSIEQRWEIRPRVIWSRPQNGCESVVEVEAIWTGSVSFDNHLEIRARCNHWFGCGDVGECVETHTHVDQVGLSDRPSSIYVNQRCGNTFHLLLGGNPENVVSKPTEYQTVSCEGDFSIPLPPDYLEIREQWYPVPGDHFIGSRLVLEVTDLSKREAIRGEAIDIREETVPIGTVGERVLSYTKTFTWDLTREPD